MEWVKKNFLLLPTDDKIYGDQNIGPHMLELGPEEEEQGSYGDAGIEWGDG
jgi:hypothetical protein